MCVCVRTYKDYKQCPETLGPRVSREITAAPFCSLNLLNLKHDALDISSGVGVLHYWVTGHGPTRSFSETAETQTPGQAFSFCLLCRSLFRPQAARLERPWRLTVQFCSCHRPSSGLALFRTAGWMRHDHAGLQFITNNKTG